MCDRAGCVSDVRSPVITGADIKEYVVSLGKDFF